MICCKSQKAMVKWRICLSSTYLEDCFDRSALIKKTHHCRLIEHPWRSALHGFVCSVRFLKRREMSREAEILQWRRGELRWLPWQRPETKKEILKHCNELQSFSSWDSEIIRNLQKNLSQIDYFKLVHCLEPGHRGYKFTCSNINYCS